MAYVRWLISEHREHGNIVRRYEVERPQWLNDWDLDVQIPKLVELELHIARDCADYFRKVPYALAETIWVRGLRPACYIPFCCDCQYGVLYYPREPKVQSIREIHVGHTGPMVLAVTLD